MAAPRLEFFCTAAGDVRVRHYNVEESFDFQVDIPAADWTTLNTNMTTPSTTSAITGTEKRAGLLSPTDYVS